MEGRKHFQEKERKDVTPRLWTVAWARPPIPVSSELSVKETPAPAA